MWYIYRQMKKKKIWLELNQVKGAAASRLRRRKYSLIERHEIPDGLLPGSVSISYTRCGKPTCRCVSGEGHPSWSWTFMMDGKKHVEHVPAAMVEEIQKRVGAGREFQDAIREVLTANAKLVVLERQQQREKRKRR